MTLGIFLFGFFVFSLYLFGLVTMISKAHKDQDNELQNDPELEGFDWEYYSKHYKPNPQSKRKKRTYKRKTKV